MNVKEMRQARKRAPVAYLDFTRQCNNLDDLHNKLFCFVEGEDSKYYSVRVSLICYDLDYEFFECNGKSEVLRLYEMINEHKEYDKHKKAYFVDKDFDESITDEFNGEIYETPCYSIENLYTTKESYKEILKSEFKISDSDDGYEDYMMCVNIFKDRQQEFHDAMRVINAWIIRQKEIYEENGNNKDKININNLSINDLVKIKLDRVEKRYNIRDLHSKMCNSDSFSIKEIKNRSESLREINPQKYFRGKFEIEFLRKILTKLRDDSSKKNPNYFSKKRNIKLNLSKNNIISELSQYASTPKCLVKYLKRFCSSLDKELVGIS